MSHSQKQEEYNYEYEDLENTMLCAKWLVSQFEGLSLNVIARLFQQAINDSEAWINTMVQNGNLPEEAAEPIRAKEAQAIHNILIKYASISDTDMREEVLREMLRITKQKQN